jgi:hypothetical protein
MKMRIIEKLMYALAIMALTGFISGCATRGGMVQTRQSGGLFQQRNSYPPNSQPAQSDPNAVNPYAPSK